MRPICSAAEALCSVTFPLHNLTCRLGHCLCDRMINRPIRGQGKGMCWGEEGECMATGCKWSPQLLTQHSNPGIRPPPTPSFFQESLLIIAESHSAAGENKHCFIYTSRFVNEALWTTLWINAQCNRWERGSSLILFSEMICKTPFFKHPYLSKCVHIISRIFIILLT